MGIKQYKHKYSVRLLISYLLVLLVPLCIGLLAYYESYKVVSQDVQEYNLVILEQAMEVIDTQLERINSVALQLSINPKVNYFKYIEDPEDNNTYFKIWELLKELKPYILKEDFISELFLYFKRSEIIVSTELSYRLHDFYGKHLQYEGMDAQAWYNEVLGKYHTGGFLPARPVTVNNRKYHAITYIKTLPIGYPDLSDGAVIALIDQTRLNELLYHANKEKEGMIYIVDKNGQVITSLTKGDIEVNPIHINTSQSMGFTESWIDGRLMTVSYITSGYNGWTYVAAVPSNLIMTKVGYIKKITWGVTLFSLVLGILVAFVLTQRNAKPLKETVKLVKDFFGGEAHRNVENEYTFLRGTITEMIANNGYLQQALKKQAPILKSVFIHQLLQGEFGGKEEIEAYLANIGLEIQGQQYMVILLNISGFKDYTSNDALKELEAERIVVREVMENYLGRRGHFYLTDRDKIVLLVSSDTEDTDAFHGEVEHMARQTHEEVWQRHHIRIAFSAGTIYKRLMDIYQSYNEARRAFDFQALNGEDPVITWYRQVPERPRQYSYSLDQELRLTNHVKAGNAEEVKRILKNIYRDNFVKRVLTSEMKQLLLYELYGTLIKLEVQLNMDEALKLKAGAVNFSEPAGRVYASIEGIYLHLCSILQEQKHRHTLGVTGKIVKHMEESYHDPDLSLAGTATAFSISEVYLSQLFKEQTGENFSVYLEKIRMKQACNLLEDSACSVNDIAMRVGYNSDKAFRRAFKRVKGVSPTEFKDHLKKENGEGVSGIK